MAGPAAGQDEARCRHCPLTGSEPQRQPRFWAELQRWGSTAVVADSSAECCGETGEWSVCVAGSTEGVGTPGAGKTLQRLSVTGRWDP